MNPQDWTPEQRENAMRYGMCLKCGTPREVHRGQRSVGGKTVMWSGIVYPCGHTVDEQDQAVSERNPEFAAYLRSIR